MQEDVLLSNQGTDASVVAQSTSELVPSIVIPTEQLEPIRDRWMRPLVERIGALEREAGRLEAQRDRAQTTAETAIRERDEARRTLEAVTLERNALQVTQTRLQDRVRELEFKMRSAQDTTALRAIAGYDLPIYPPVRHRRMAFWKRS